MWSALSILACATAEPSADSADPGPVEPLFSFAIFADPHVTGEGENAERLRAAIDWVNVNADVDDIDLVVIVGDIGWAGGETLAFEILSTLAVPWVPVLGDNEVQYGSEQSFDQVFAVEYAALAATFENWDRAATPVENPEYDKQSWFQDFSFDHGGAHFVGLDWNSRHLGGIEGEMADLHDFDGGSWRWLATDLEGLAAGPDNRVLFFSHHPMHLSPGAFDLAEIDLLDGLLNTYDDAVFANFAGHYHVSGDESDPARPLDVYVTDALWDDINTLRVVAVSGNEAALSYEQRLVELP